MGFRKLTGVAIAVAMFSFGSPASASLTFQGVTFETFYLGGNTLELDISDALTGGTGNWTDISYLSAFEIKGIGQVTGAILWSTTPAASSWEVNVDNGLSANVGCRTGGTPGACFSLPPMPLSDSMSFVVEFFGTGLDFEAPHLKVQFLVDIDDRKANNDLLSLPVPSTTRMPEPGTLALLFAALSLLVWGGSRRTRTAVIAGRRRAARKSAPAALSAFVLGWRR